MLATEITVKPNEIYMNLNVLRHSDNLATGFDVLMQQCGIVKLQRSRCSEWLLMTRSDFYGCVINGPITDSNAIASNHSPFNQGCSVCGQPWAEHRATSQIKARWPGCVHASMAVWLTITGTVVCESHIRV